MYNSHIPSQLQVMRPTAAVAITLRQPATAGDWSEPHHAAQPGSCSQCSQCRGLQLRVPSTLSVLTARQRLAHKQSTALLTATVHRVKQSDVYCSACISILSEAYQVDGLWGRTQLLA